MAILNPNIHFLERAAEKCQEKDAPLEYTLGGRTFYIDVRVADE